MTNSRRKLIGNCYQESGVRRVQLLGLSQVCSLGRNGSVTANYVSSLETLS